MIGYVGCYTDGESRFSGAHGEGIVRVSVDSETGRPAGQSPAARIRNPSWLHLSEDGRFLYAVSECFDTEGEVHRYAVGSGGNLRHLATRPAPGKATCHLTATAEHLYAASYLDGCITRYALEENGLSAPGKRIVYEGSGPHPKRQQSPHAHQAVVSPDGKWLYVCDLGGDCLRRHRLEGGGDLPFESFPLPAGSGPRHLVFHPALPLFYVFCELQPLLLEWEVHPATGNPRLRKCHDLSQLPGGEQIGAGAAIHIHPSGKLLGISERAAHSVRLFRLDAQGGLHGCSQVPGQGETPRDFAFSPDGKSLWVAYQDSHLLVRFAIDAGLAADPEPADRLSLPSPTCICFLPA